MKLDLPMATSAEFAKLADEYQAGFDKCLASGYEEFSSEEFQRERRMVIAALRAASALRALAELPPRS
jgi:hypothetical protein